MPTLLIRFPGGRYHTTPSGHHVNEGQIEWPPSPWRLLRALLACGYNTLGWEGDLCKPMENQPPPVARSLILKLADVLPSYAIPQAVGTHSRHYMPLATIDKGREKTALVFDTWAQLGDQALAVTWDVDLTLEESTLLSALAERLGYLGRSESWAEAKLASLEDVCPLPNCLPTDALSNPGIGWEQIPVMAVQRPADFDHWRNEVTGRFLEPLQPPAGKKPTKALLTKREKAILPYPADLIACLQADTNWLRDHGWSQPPGSERVFYWRPSDILEPGAPGPRKAAREAPSVEAMLLSLCTDSGNDHALPAITRVLPQAELLHRALGGRIKRIAGHSPVISGCDAEGRPLKGAHRHAHILPLDLDGDQHLEHILVWAPMGLDQVAQSAVRGVRNTDMKGGAGRLKVALAAAGDLADLRGLTGEYGERMGRLLGPVDGAAQWLSLTPFVAPRFTKRSGRNSLEEQVRSELLSRGIQQQVEIERLDPWTSRSPVIRMLFDDEQGSGIEPEVARPRWARFRHFVRTRRNGPAPPVDCGFALRLRFAEPVRGPLCVGYGSHFGLGLFQAEA